MSHSVSYDMIAFVSVGLFVNFKLPFWKEKWGII